MFSMGDVLKADVDAARKILLPPPRPTTDVTQLLAAGGVVVVVGGRPSNFTTELLENPRIVFWHSTDPKGFHKDRIPTNAKAVIFVGGFMGHDVEGRIRKQAKDRGIFSPPGFVMTGEAKEMLTKMLTRPAPLVVPDTLPLPAPPPPVVPTESAAKEEPVVAKLPVLRKLFRAELKNYVIAHADPKKKSLDEAHRIFPVLTAKGIQTTLLSVEQAVRFYVTQPAKKANGTAQQQRPKVADAVPSSAAVDRALAEIRTTELALGVDPPKPARLATTPNALLDQVESALAAVELLTEALQKIKSDVQRLRQTQQTLREFLD